MEAKQLAIQSFERNQGLLESINKVIIHLKLARKGIDDKVGANEVDDAKKLIVLFLKKLNSLVSDLESHSNPLTGIDLRYRSLVKKYVEAKGRKQQFRSALFRVSPLTVMEFMGSNNPDDVTKLIDSLTEFRSLLEDHGLADTKELIGEL